DLWAFNEEIVARAIYDSKTPIVSAVGHEIDFTISDFVADLRAPTPSAAAELVVPSQIELVEKFNNVYTRLYRQATQIVEKKRMTLKYFIDKPVLSNPIMKINENRLRLDGVSRMFENAYTNVLERKRQNLNVSVSKLDGLSPLSTMTRGFSVVKDDKGEVVKSTTQVKSGDMLTLVVTDGEISTTVN
ncbi:MAG: exodeoxyribonuclease VII large subunit, partial [Oscillospiraceae bacterium]